MPDQPFPEKLHNYLGGDSPPVGRGHAATRFVRAVEAWHPESSEAVSKELQNAACAFVDELKRLDLPPEQVLVVVKDLLIEDGVVRDADAQRQLVERVVTWCIKAYYDIG